MTVLIGHYLFKLTPADGARGSHAAAATGAYTDFNDLAKQVLARIDGLE